MAEVSLLFVRPDRDVAERLAQALEAHGLDVDLSASAIDDHTPYDGVVVLLSPGSVRSAVVMGVAELALAAGKLAPVFIGLCTPPPALRACSFYDLSDWDGAPTHSTVVQLAQLLRRHRTAKDSRRRLTDSLAMPPTPQPAPQPPPQPPPAPSLWDGADWASPPAPRPAPPAAGPLWTTTTQDQTAPTAGSGLLTELLDPPAYAPAPPPPQSAPTRQDWSFAARPPDESASESESPGKAHPPWGMIEVIIGVGLVLGGWLVLAMLT
jgi:hypothetical protein